MVEIVVLSVVCAHAGSTQYTQNTNSTETQNMGSNGGGGGSGVWPQARDEVVFFHLSDKMPDYALKSHFKKYGAVLEVCLHAKDPRCGRAQLGMVFWMHKPPPCCSEGARASATFLPQSDVVMHSPGCSKSVTLVQVGCGDIRVLGSCGGRARALWR
jgi:hypothetical protein